MGREEQNGGLYEEEATPKQHRKPERILRYTHLLDTLWQGSGGRGLCCSAALLIVNPELVKLVVSPERETV